MLAYRRHASGSNESSEKSWQMIGNKKLDDNTFEVMHELLDGKEKVMHKAPWNVDSDTSGFGSQCDSQQDHWHQEDWQWQQDSWQKNQRHHQGDWKQDDWHQDKWGQGFQGFRPGQQSSSSTSFGVPVGEKKPLKQLKNIDQKSKCLILSKPIYFIAFYFFYILHFCILHVCIVHFCIVLFAFYFFYILHFCILHFCIVLCITFASLRY